MNEEIDEKIQKVKDIVKSFIEKSCFLLRFDLANINVLEDHALLNISKSDKSLNNNKKSCNNAEFLVISFVPIENNKLSCFDYFFDTSHDQQISRINFIIEYDLKNKQNINFGLKVNFDSLPDYYYETSESFYLDLDDIKNTVKNQSGNLNIEDYLERFKHVKLMRELYSEILPYLNNICNMEVRKELKNLDIKTLTPEHENLLLLKHDSLSYFTKDQIESTLDNLKVLDEELDKRYKIIEQYNNESLELKKKYTDIFKNLEIDKKSNSIKPIIQERK